MGVFAGQMNLQPKPTSPRPVVVRSGAAEDAPRAHIGDVEFTRLFAAARPKLWIIAAAVLNDRTEADDVVQEAAIVGLAKRGDFQQGTSFEGWMGQITRNLALNASRRRHRRFVSSDAVRPSGLKIEHADRASTPLADQAGRVDDARRLVTALADLEPVARECLVLRIVAELPYAVISEIVGVPEGTAMSHVHRTRQALRQRLLAGELRQGGRP